MVVIRLRDRWSKAGSAWTPELVAYALDRFHKRNLRTPTVRELRAGAPGLPSHSTIRRHYGSASAMLKAHGYAVRSRGGQPGHACWVLRDDRGLFVSREPGCASHESTAAAQRRPSLIAQTISD